MSQTLQSFDHWTSAHRHTKKTNILSLLIPFPLLLGQEVLFQAILFSTRFCPLVSNPLNLNTWHRGLISMMSNRLTVRSGGISSKLKTACGTTWGADSLTDQNMLKEARILGNIHFKRATIRRHIYVIALVADFGTGFTKTLGESIELLFGWNWRIRVFTTTILTLVGWRTKLNP